MFRIVCRNLSCQFRTNRSYTCDQNHFSRNILEDFVHVCFNRITSQKLFNLHRLHLTDRNFSSVQLIHSRKVQEFTLCLITNTKNFSSLFCIGARNRYIDFLNSKLGNSFHDVFSATKYRNIIYISAPLI